MVMMLAVETAMAVQSDSQVPKAMLLALPEEDCHEPPNEEHPTDHWDEMLSVEPACPKALVLLSRVATTMLPQAVSAMLSPDVGLPAPLHRPPPASLPPNVMLASTMTLLPSIAPTQSHRCRVARFLPCIHKGHSERCT